jgi:hypothetical protein
MHPCLAIQAISPIVVVLLIVSPKLMKTETPPLFSSGSKRNADDVLVEVASSPTSPSARQ